MAKSKSKKEPTKKRRPVELRELQYVRSELLAKKLGKDRHEVVNDAVYDLLAKHDLWPELTGGEFPA
jgi:hypothetical protein